MKLETELKLLQALSEQKKEYDLKLESMRKEFQAQIAKIVSDFENKVDALIILSIWWCFLCPVILYPDMICLQSAEQLKNFEDKYKSDKQNFE